MPEEIKKYQNKLVWKATTVLGALTAGVLGFHEFGDRQRGHYADANVPKPKEIVELERASADLAAALQRDGFRVPELITKSGATTFENARVSTNLLRAAERVLAAEEKTVYLLPGFRDHWQRKYESVSRSGAWVSNRERRRRVQERRPPLRLNRNRRQEISAVTRRLGGKRR